MLTVSSLGFAYPPIDGHDALAVLHDVNLMLSAGQAKGLLGPNGSGKSTLLGAITDSIQGTTTGVVHMLAGAIGPIGFATQNPALYQHLTVHENLVHAARLATGQWRVSDLVGAAVHEYQLDDILGITARHLSGGQTRLAHLACSFIHKPSVRLLDEPTTALDFETRQLLVDLVHGWRDEGVAVLVTAHYPEDIEELCTELVVLVDGVTHELGPITTHLRSLGTTATIRTGAGSVDLDIVSPTLASVVAAAKASGISSEQSVEHLKMSPPTLREVLQRDPTLRSAVADRAEQAQGVVA